MNFNKGTEIISPPGTVTINVQGERGLKTVFLIAIAFVIMLQTCFLPITYSAPSAMPEKFIYDLAWTGIKAGTASLELRNDGKFFRPHNRHHGYLFFTLLMTGWKAPS
jgi:hypothetical protein